MSKTSDSLWSAYFTAHGAPGYVRGRFRIANTAAAQAAAQEMRGCTIHVTVVESLNPSGYLEIAEERYRDTGELLPGVEIIPDASVHPDAHLHPESEVPA